MRICLEWNTCKLSCLVLLGLISTLSYLVAVNISCILCFRGFCCIDQQSSSFICSYKLTFLITCHIITFYVVGWLRSKPSFLHNISLRLVGRFSYLGYLEYFLCRLLGVLFMYLLKIISCPLSMSTYLVTTSRDLLAFLWDKITCET